MRIGASTFIWVSPFNADTLDLICHVRDLGFEQIEICVEDPNTIDCTQVRDRLARADLAVSVCGAFGPSRDNSSDNATVRAAALAYTKRCVDIAADLGGSLVVGPMYAGVGGTKMLDDDARREQWERAVEALGQAADHAATRGVSLALEPINRFETDLVNTVDQGVRMVGDIGRPNVGLLIDTFHMNIEEKSVPDAIRRAGRYILEFHACSSDRGTPGEDHLPWPEIVTALRETDYAGAVVIEAFNPRITSIARAVSLWRPLAESEDALAGGGLAHLRRVFA